MYRLIVISLFFIGIFFNSKTKSDKYNIEEFYSGKEVEATSIFLNSSDDIADDIKTELQEFDLKLGKYSISVSKIDDNLYKVDGKDIYIKTKYCHEYATRDDVILLVTSNSGYTKGEIIFNLE